jgi:hypothetical protein
MDHMVSITPRAPLMVATSSQVSGQITAADTSPAILDTAVKNMRTAYTDASTRPAQFNNEGAGLLGGLILRPGVHKWTTTVTIASTLVLSGDCNSVFILQVA